MFIRMTRAGLVAGRWREQGEAFEVPEAAGRTFLKAGAAIVVAALELAPAPPAAAVVEEARDRSPREKAAGRK